MNNLEKIKYIDEKINHLRIKRRIILNEIKKDKKHQIDKKLSDRELLAKRFCNGEKISSLAREFKIRNGTMFGKVKHLLVKRVHEQNLMKDIPFFYGYYGIQHYKKLLNNINYYK